MTKKAKTDSRGNAWALMLSAQARLVERIETALGDAGLPPLGWYDVLWELEKAEAGQLRMHELAVRIVLSRPNLTRLADRLEKEGLLTRAASTDDRRGYYCVITRAGRDLRRKMWTVYAAQIDALFAQHISEQEAETMAAALERMLLAVKPESN